MNFNKQKSEDRISTHPKTRSQQEPGMQTPDLWVAVREVVVLVHLYADPFERLERRYSEETSRFAQATGRAWGQRPNAVEVGGIMQQLF